jgi:hypothetical protein
MSGVSKAQKEKNLQPVNGTRFCQRPPPNDNPRNVNPVKRERLPKNENRTIDCIVKEDK